MPGRSRPWHICGEAAIAFPHLFRSEWSGTPDRGRVMSPRRPFAFPLIVLLVGCDTPLEDQSAILINTRLDRGAVMTGEIVEITITASNTLDREVTFVLPNSCGPMFELRSPDGRVAVPVTGALTR